MKQFNHISTLLQQVRLLPLFVLRLSTRKRLLIVILSYLLGVPGLWYFFPRVHNGAPILLTIISASWLFRYKGMFISLALNVLAFLVIYYFLLPHMLFYQHFLERVTVGSAISLVLGLIICWFHTAVNIVQAARARTLAAEQERSQALRVERETTLAYEHQCKLNELKDQFLLNVSHELRTPLTVLGGSLELLKVYYDELDPTMRDEALTQAIENHNRLVNLVNRVLEAITVTQEFSPAQCEAVHVQQIVQEVLSQLDLHDLEAYTFCVQVSEQVVVWADPQYLIQVLHNLLGNVFKYVPKQTKVRIATTQPTPTSAVCLSVQDAGPGISPQEIPLLFERFVRLKRDLARTTPGTGLGLYICKQLVEAMGGQIWVESSGRAGEGCRFCLTLPAVPPSTSEMVREN